jgi:catechol 2,3-dioxygenase-like lactoylglutathione lyase family enzyme
MAMTTDKTMRTGTMRIGHMRIFFDDQDKALRFYTDVLGFVKKAEVPLGEFRWLTVVGPEEPDGVEVVLEPDQHPAAAAFKQALVADGIPFTMFGVTDVYAEFRRLKRLGVVFTQEPMSTGGMITAVLDDTCGNLIQIVAPEKAAA